jgi:hypothetical protein
MANGYGAFGDFYTDVLETEPQMAYMGAVSRQAAPSSYTAPMQRRAQDYLRNQYSNVYNEYLGRRAQELRQRKDPSKWTTFSDFLEETPFTQRYSQLSPYQRGVSTSRFAPSTRRIFF